MPKPTIIYKVWCIINEITRRIYRLSYRLYCYTNGKALEHSPAIKWLLEPLMNKSKL